MPFIPIHQRTTARRTMPSDSRAWHLTILDYIALAHMAIVVFCLALSIHVWLTQQDDDMCCDHRAYWSRTVAATGNVAYADEDEEEIGEQGLLQPELVEMEMMACDGYGTVAMDREEEEREDACRLWRGRRGTWRVLSRGTERREDLDGSDQV